MSYEPYLLIPLRRRDGTLRAHAIIDAADAELAEHRWCRLKSGYVHRRTPAGFVRLHRVILGLEPGDPREGDHVNGDRLDCRRSNLRVATNALNGQNIERAGGTSRHRGVSWDPVNHKWRAQAQVNGKQVNLGRFTDEQAAADTARAYRLAHMPFTNEDRQARPTRV